MVEFDVRRRGDELVVSHDPPRGGEPLLRDVLDALDGPRRARRRAQGGRRRRGDLRAAPGRGRDRHVVPRRRDPARSGASGRSCGRGCCSASPARAATCARARSELFPVDRLWRCGADFAAPHLSLARLGALRRAGAAGYPSLVWTVNEERDLAALLADSRVAGVITDAAGTRRAGAQRRGLRRVVNRVNRSGGRPCSVHSQLGMLALLLAPGSALAATKPAASTGAATKVTFQSARLGRHREPARRRHDHLLPARPDRKYGSNTVGDADRRRHVGQARDHRRRARCSRTPSTTSAWWPRTPPAR